MMLRSERVTRAYISVVMFAQAFVLESYLDLTAWQVTALLGGAGAIALPLASPRPGILLRAVCTVLAMLSAMMWVLAGWPIALVGWTAWAALMWYYTLPDRTGMTPEERARRRADPSPE
jgi:hypothetical protein